MDDKQKAAYKSTIDQAVGELGPQKVALILQNYIKRQKQLARVREFVKEARAAGKI